MKLDLSKNFYGKNCLGVMSVITIILLLGVTISGFFLFSNWYNNFLPTVQDENFGSYSFNDEYIDFLKVINDSGSYSLIIRNKVPEKFNVTSISVEGLTCPIISNTIIEGDSITYLNLSCTNFNQVSSVLVITDFGVILSNVLVE